MPVKESVEKEYKGLITEAEYTRLTERYSPEIIPQTNYYFDTPNLELHRKGITLRVREKKSGTELTLKTGDGRKDNVSVRREYNSGLPNGIVLRPGISFAEILSSCNADINIFMQEMLPMNGAEDIRLLGSLTTERGSIDIGNNIFLELDKNSYLGFTDYEVEFEYEDETELTVLHKFISANRITPALSAGKYTRFISRLK